MLCCCSDSTKRYNKHPLAHWQEMIVVEFQFHPLEESLSGIHCSYVLWSGASRDASKDISAHCEDPGNDGQLHVTENWLNTRNENRLRKVWFYCRSLSGPIEAVCCPCPVQLRGERISSRPSSAVTRAGRTDASYWDKTQGCERDSHWNHSQSSQTWDGGFDADVNVDSKDYFSVSAVKAEPKPRPDKILGKQICQDPCSQAWHLLNKLDKPFYVSASSDRVKSQNCKNKTHPKTVH